jgi:bleomycin hydrolase
MDNRTIDIASIRAHYRNEEPSPVVQVMKNAIIANGIETVAFNNTTRIGLQNNFSHEIKSGKITSQEKSGRCWMFAGLNIFRSKITKSLNIDDFEFSQNYPMFYDKLEKANYFLESILRTLDEDVYSRIIMWLLNDPLQDGGQWDMFVNLLNKYGAVPKTVMPETYHSSNSAIMNQLLTSQLRQWAAALRKDHAKGAGQADLRARKQEFVTEFYRMLTYFLGDPPDTFSYDYYDKDEKHQSIDRISPREFFTKYVGTDMDEYVSLIHAPTPDKPFGRTFTVDFLGNVVEGRKVKYLNTSIENLKQCSIKQIKAGEPVWFGCDIRMQTERKKGLMDPKVFLFEHSLGTDSRMDKSERLLFGDSLLTHAMVLTGVHLQHEKPVRWKVENSWGEERGEKGFFIMSDPWFDEFNYQVVIHKKYLTSEMIGQLNEEPIVLPPWDPMGSLAITN